jgi:hypothetical protein
MGEMCAKGTTGWLRGDLPSPAVDRERPFEAATA